jgi:CheY-like chemotaxis protein
MLEEPGMTSRGAADEQKCIQCTSVQVIGVSRSAMTWRSNCYNRAAVDTPVRLLVVDLDARHHTVTTDLAEEEGIDVRTAVDATGAISQCRLEYLDLVMINAGIDGESGVSLLEAIRTLRPTVRAVLMNGAQVPIRHMLRELRNEPRHVPCFDA